MGETRQRRSGGRHLDGSVTKMVRETPRRVLREKRAQTTAQLRLELQEMQPPPGPPDQLDLEEWLASYEQIAPGADQLEDAAAAGDEALPYWARMP